MLRPKSHGLLAFVLVIQIAACGPAGLLPPEGAVPPEGGLLPPESEFPRLVPEPATEEAQPLTPTVVHHAWLIDPSPAADLWYHGLAVLGVTGQGPLSFYSDEYVRAIRVEKERAGVFPTQLDSLDSDLAAQIAGDDALRLFHFVPLYYHGIQPERLLAALDAVARRNPGDPALSGRDIRYGSALMFQTVERGDQRRALGTFVRALQDEWEVFYRAYWNRNRADREARFDALRARWADLEADLADFLRRHHLQRGTLIPSPPLGGEGRLVAGEATDRFGTIVAVRMPLEGQDVQIPLYSAVKELCFELLDRVIGRAGSEEVETRRAHAAVRCGAQVLAFHSPALVVGYRRFFLGAAGRDISQGTTVAQFEAAYPLDRDVVLALMEEVRRR